MGKIKTISVFTLMAALVLFLSSCQPSPSNDVVINKADGNFEELIQQTLSLDTKYEVPERWEETLDLKTAKIIINSNIEIGSGNSHPLYQVSRREFSEDEVTTLFNYIAPNIKGIRLALPTKAELEEELIRIKRGVYQEGEDGKGQYVPFDNQEELITRIEKQISTTSDTITYTPVDEWNSEVPCDISCELGGGEVLRISASKDELSVKFGESGIIQPERWIKNGGSYPGEAEGTTLKNVNITKDFAIEYAERILRENNIANIGVVSAEKARILDDYSYETISEGWVLLLSRIGEGSLATDQRFDVCSYQWLEYDETQYRAPWSLEGMMMFVDETGLRSVEWYDPLATEQVLNPNLSLLPFSEIQIIIRDQLKFGLSWVSDMENTWQGLTVYRIVLTSCLIPIKDNPNSAYIVPVWFVYLSTEDNIERGVLPDILAINAVDGSRIDPLYWG